MTFRWSPLLLLVVGCAGGAPPSSPGGAQVGDKPDERRAAPSAASPSAAAPSAVSPGGATPTQTQPEEPRSTALQSDPTDAALRYFQQKAAPLVAAGHPDPLGELLPNFAPEPGPHAKLKLKDGEIVFSAARPKGVLSEEWQALKLSELEVQLDLTSSETQEVELEWLDVGGGRERELLATYYYGGTGLYSYTYVLSLEDERYLLPKMNAPDESPEPHYSICGRGADNQIQWIEFGGHTLLTHREGYFGYEELTIWRADELVDNPWTLGEARRDQLRVSFAYQHRLAPPDGDDSKSVLLQTYGLAIQEQLDKVSARGMTAGALAEQKLGYCPGDGEQGWLGSTHYTQTAVADFPIRVGGECWAGRLLYPLSSYGKKTPYIFMGLEMAKSAEVESEFFSVHSTRRAVGLRLKE